MTYSKKVSAPFLLIDNSNSFSKIRLSDKKELKEWNKIIPTKEITKKTLLSSLKEISFEQVILCSVVPKVATTIKKALNDFPLIEINANQAPPYLQAKQIQGLGNDRIANCLAAHSLYQSPAIIIDAGTVITIDIISKEGKILGGFLFPGLEIAKTYLPSSTEQIPLILDLKKVDIGTNTKEALQGGIFYGYQGLLESILKQAKQFLPEKHLIIATGGDSNFIKQILDKKVDIFNPHLTLEGLRLFSW